MAAMIVRFPGANQRPDGVRDGAKRVGCCIVVRESSMHSVRKSCIVNGDSIRGIASSGFESFGFNGCTN